jgi:predicted anti-sigma-YlaC factor YlaD
VKCSEFLHELTDYLDGVIDASTKAELDEHLAWCHNCYVVCDTTKKTIEIYPIPSFTSSLKTSRPSSDRP